MKNRQFHRIVYKVRHDYLTMNNIVLGLALLIAMSWGWSSVEAVQRNYQLQREVSNKARQQKLLDLETENLKFEQRYYQSAEYHELELKRRLGLANPGEKLLILPPNSDRAKMVDKLSEQEHVAAQQEIPPTPFEQWLDFLFGHDRPTS